MLSPGRSFALSSVHSSGRWRFGSHWPFGSRTEKMRSLARERSSSRRAPPMAASKSPACSPSSSALVFRRPQQRCVPTLNGCVPSAIASWFVWTISRAPTALAISSRNSNHLAELVGGVDVQQRETESAPGRRLSAPAAAAPTSPCRSSRASPAARTRRPLRGGCGCSRPPGREGDRACSVAGESGVTATVDISVFDATGGSERTRPTKKRPGVLPRASISSACRWVVLVLTQTAGPLPRGPWWSWYNNTRRDNRFGVTQTSDSIRPGPGRQIGPTSPDRVEVLCRDGIRHNSGVPSEPTSSQGGGSSDSPEEQPAASWKDRYAALKSRLGADESRARARASGARQSPSGPATHRRAGAGGSCRARDTQAGGCTGTNVRSCGPRCSPT